MRRIAARLRDDERGAGYLAAFIVLFSVLVVAGVGILVDSARIFSADRQCTSIAFEAARAGANALAADSLYGGDGFIVDPDGAQRAARQAAADFVSAAGATLESVSVDGNQVTVVVSARVDSWFPLISDRTVRERTTADAVVVMDGAALP